MLRAAVAALACLCCVRSSLAEPHALRAYALKNHNTKDLPSILANIEERLRVLDTVNAFQVKQARRLDVIQDKLDRMETALSLRLERAQLVAERLEHRLHMMENNVEATIKESSQRLERSQAKIVDLTVNLTSHIEKHKHLLEKVNGAYSETWRRGLLVEGMMRDGLSLVNVTRRELADGLRALARRHRDAKLSTADLEVAFTRRLNENTQKIDFKMQSILEAQKQIVDSCQRVQLDDPTHVADVLDKLIDSLINKTASTFHELQNIQSTLRNHDNKVMKLIGSGRNTQGDATCRRLESVIRNASHTSFKETELKQLTEKFIDLTDRADAALQRLETKINEDREVAEPPSEVTAEADRLFIKLNGIKSEHESYEDWDEQDTGFFDDGGEGDLMSEDAEVLNRGSLKEKKYIKSPTTRAPHQRHLHKHPYDRGPSWKNPSP